MSNIRTALRAAHDVGLAAWFGGTLANAVSLNAAAGQAGAAKDRGMVANIGWNRWTPVNAAAIGLHLAGAGGLLAMDRRRVAVQQGVTAMAITKSALTAAALGVTGYSRVLGSKVSAQPGVPVASGTQPTSETPPTVSAAQKQLRVLQWAVPALTGAVVVISSLAGEQQRPREVARGTAKRLSTN